MVSLNDDELVVRLEALLNVKFAATVHILIDKERSVFEPRLIAFENSILELKGSVQSIQVHLMSGLARRISDLETQGRLQYKNITDVQKQIILHEDQLDKNALIHEDIKRVFDRIETGFNMMAKLFDGR